MYYKERLDTLSLTTIRRRLRGDMIGLEVFKILKVGFYEIY